jgi:D-beta-D-heptose 7-phosphate kinase/D-beta-D-heptose 1-phosphate adenosyltransferase
MTLVTCNGCFESPLHPGHTFFLGYCLAQGDELVVGINSDEYIRRKKGYEPTPASKRAQAIMRLGHFIKDVIVFDEDDPCEFIRRVRPNVHCTGAEYMAKCPEKFVCDELHIRLVFVPRVGDWSTRRLKGMIP